VTEFGRMLETQLDQIVVNETGIPGTFDFKLSRTPDEAETRPDPPFFYGDSGAILPQTGIEKSPSECW
jgi:uncharacterized protein (TIGR03435 family)